MKIALLKADPSISFRTLELLRWKFLRQPGTYCYVMKTLFKTYSSVFHSEL